MEEQSEQVVHTQHDQSRLADSMKIANLELQVEDLKEQNLKVSEHLTKTQVQLKEKTDEEAKSKHNCAVLQAKREQYMKEIKRLME